MSIYTNPKRRFSVKNSLLYFKHRLCVTNIRLRNEPLHDFLEIDSAGHLGERKTRHKISQLYYWKTLRNDFAEYVKSCPIRQKRESRNTKPFEPLQPLAPPHSKWSVITMDFIGPLPETKNGNIHILNVVDKLSKILRIIPLPDTCDAIIVARRFMENVYRSHGLLDKIISGRDSIFMRKFW